MNIGWFQLAPALLGAAIMGTIILLTPQWSTLRRFLLFLALSMGIYALLAVIEELI